MKKLIVIAWVLILTGCGARYIRTDLAYDDPDMQPQVLKGSYREVFDIACAAGKRVFPDTDDITCGEEPPNVVIVRNWFFRGDTIVSVWITKTDEGGYLVEAESRKSWHRINPSPYRVCEDEVKWYIEALKTEYASARKKAAGSY
jgi:hypothetical protein